MQTKSFHSPHETGRPTTSHLWLGLAILSLACPDLAADHPPNSNTYKPQTNASRLKQDKAQRYGKQRHKITTFLRSTFNMGTIDNYKYTSMASTNFTLAS
jgi:hypothetical protein